MILRILKKTDSLPLPLSDWNGKDCCNLFELGSYRKDFRKRSDPIDLRIGSKGYLQGRGSFRFEKKKRKHIL
ncbi:hypothetical protein DLM75_14255 [Leptospira stimsonii]|uniref:Uncharacterized protein n=1 Tax=Leptospira stimsonii TaxID=2202203 RepID=A0A396ZAA5_9LEPT|nr:hypothetical protein DLM75_14255 [Leptospira stimsonii]